MLAKERRENLLTHVKEARRVVEDAFDRALAGLGLFKDRDPLPLERITDPTKQKVRQAIDQVMARDRDTGGLSYTDARQRYVEHCAFTLVNRVAALRAMEVRGFLSCETIAQDAQYGGLSPWARDLLEAGRAEILGETISITTPDEARWQAVRVASAAVAQAVGVLFDLSDEYSLVVPESAAVKSLIAELTESITEEDWLSDDILGWVYQYYNVPANVAFKVRRKRRGYKMTADDMIVANQFYTPHWVVRVLVDNTLGRIWWESIPDLARQLCGPSATPDQIASEGSRLRTICRETCAYLVPLPDEQRLGWWADEAKAKAEARAIEEACKRHVESGGKPEDAPAPTEPHVPTRPWKKVRDLKIIDPACGSGHFLLYVFDVLRRMYDVELPADRPEPSTVPDLILSHNLHGIDVDLRACQLAAFNLYLKARLAYREIAGRDEFHPSGMKITCASARVTDGENRRQLLDSFADNVPVQELAEQILNNLSHTAEIGSLLKVRQKFEPLLRRQRMVRGQELQASFLKPATYQADLFKDRVVEEYTLPQIIERLTAFEAEARPSGDVGRLLFAREVAKSCGLLALLSQTYDVALMNPPYGKMPPDCKEYCEGNPRKGIEPHYPATSNDLYAVFIERCVELVLEDSFVGMLTSQTFMYLKSFATVRTQVLNTQAPPEILCDTGFNVLDGAKVITATSVLRKEKDPDHTRACICIRAFQENEQEKEQVLVQSLDLLKLGDLHPRVFVTSIAVFTALPNSIYAYWVPSNIAKLFATYPPLDRDIAGRPEQPKIADCKQGLATADNLRFARFFWEVDTSQIGLSAIDSQNGRPWSPFAIGGWLDCFQSDVGSVVNWANNGEELKKYERARVQNERFYFRQGISWHSAPQYPSNQTRMNARLLPAGSIFTNSVHALFTSESLLGPLLGYLNSELVFYLIRLFEMRKILNGTVALLPFPKDHDLSQVALQARSARQLLLTASTSNECSPYFVAPALLLATKSVRCLGCPSGHPQSSEFQWPGDDEIRDTVPEAAHTFDLAFGKPEPLSASLHQLAATAWQRQTSVDRKVSELQGRIDDAVYGIFGIQAEDRRHIAEEIAFRQCQPLIEDDPNDLDDSDEDVGASEANGQAPLAELTTDVESFTREQTARLVSYAVKLAAEADVDGVIPITRFGSEPTLADRVKAQFAEWFGQDQFELKWVEAGQIFGKPVADWLDDDYFDYHVSMYWNRPIFWQLTSAYGVPRGSLPGAFSCLVHYHKLQGNTLQNIRAHYVAGALETAQAQYDAVKATYETQERIGANRRDLSRARQARDEAQKRLSELVEFDRRLQELDTGARPVTPPPEPDDPWVKQKIAEVTGGPAYGGRGWLPVIDYGVRVNIEPLKMARVLHRAADRVK